MITKVSKEKTEVSRQFTRFKTVYSLELAWDYPRTNKKIEAITAKY
jgi:hypothetical protein